MTGKWLFPRDLIDQWVSSDARIAGAPTAPPPVIAGSHDPLLEWCINQAQCGLAMLPGGSLDGIERLAAGELTLLYSEGYERIFAQLERLRDSSSSWLHDETTLALLPGADMALRRWSRIVPES